MIFDMQEIKELLDAEKLNVYGPRRSVSMLKFCLRTGESEHDLRERMWKVVRAIAGAKYILPSTRVGDDSKMMWSSFVKTRNARLRSSHVSMVRRVTIALAKDSFDRQAGGMGQGLNLQTTAYDCDWNNGTIWCGTRKLASSSHRAPREEEVVTMTGGWVSLSAVALTALCSVEEAKLAFERVVRGDLSAPCAKRRWGRVGHWNLGGQKLDMLDVICQDLDILLVQEVARGQEGWSEFGRDEFHWITHRSSDQWRGVAVGIAIDKFDSTVKKIKTSRGIWVVGRICGIGRVILGSLHCHTGATNETYQAAVREFFSACPRKYRHLPLVCGVDANEVPRWKDSDAGRLEIDSCCSNLNTLLHESMHIGIFPVPPEPVFKNAWTHFPRDETRSGRQIDMVLHRQLHLKDLTFDADRRLALGTDHALLVSELLVAGGVSRTKWKNESRARWVTSDIQHSCIVDEDDLVQIARQHTRPRFSQSFRDDPETSAAIRQARDSNTREDWKRVQRMRREKRKCWQQARLSSILSGDWDAYRQLQSEKKRRRGWWGDMLEDRSAAQLAGEIEDHLRNKMTSSREPSCWDDRLEALIAECSPGVTFRPFELHEVVTELQQMKCRSAVGPDGIGVHLLRVLASHETLGGELLGLINFIVATQQLPPSWSKSFLALIAKEWKQPFILGKLDVAGAFDKINRERVAKFLITKLQNVDLPHELRYMLAQLRTHTVCGTAPGGTDISFRPDVGIKQGAPESAELFAMIVDSMLSDLTACEQWKRMGSPFRDVDLDLLQYQDDIFVLETDMSRLCRRIKIIDRCLERIGLRLATSKTKIVANEFYAGPRRVKINDDVFSIAPRGEALKVLGLSFSLSSDASEQAHEIISRVRAAAAFHSDILCAPGSWKAKVGMMRTLLESQFNWIGDSVSSHEGSPVEMHAVVAPPTVIDDSVLPQRELMIDMIDMIDFYVYTCLACTSSSVDSEQHDSVVPRRGLRDVGVTLLPWLEPWLPSRHGLCGAALHVVFFVLLVGVALLVGGMDRGGDLPAAEPATHPPWTDEEIAERRAEAWGNVTWSSPWSTWPGWEENAPPSANVHLQAAPTESTPSSGVTLPPPSSSSSAPSTGMTFPSLSSSPQEVPLQAGSAMSLSPVHHDLQDSTWDENISLGLQEEEVHLAGGWGDRGPLAPIPEDVPPPFGLPGPAASSDAKPMDLINQEADNVSLDKLLDVRPLRGRRPLRADGLSPLPLGRDPSSLATPKNSGQLRPGEIDWSSPGITRRGSSVRPGIDRWHHLDGTIRYRLREQQGNASGGQASGSAPQTCAKDDESGTGGASSSASSWTSTSFYPAKQVQSGREEKEALQETSTCDTGRGDISSTAVSSNSSCTEVGFWRHGEWHARERTPQEARLHRGGNGPQRSHRKQQRMNSYFQGEWRPAWLEKYIEDRNKRSQAAEIQEPARPQSASDLADTAPTSSTDVDPWSGQWTGRDDSWWGSSTWGVTSWFSWNASWSWTSSTTTAEPTMEVPQELPPNHGLFPDVGPALPPAPPNPWLLQLTGAERRLLQEGGVPELPLERIDLLLECLEDHQAAEHGAEARWALARLARRLEDALDSLQLVLEILVRRLQPRGYLPVVRTPATRAEQVRLLDWMRRSTSFLAETLEYHLQSPLESSEVNLGTPRVPWASSPESHGPGVGQHGHASDNASGGTGAASSSSSSPALRTAGSEEPVRSRSRSPVPVPSAMEMGVDAYGYDICLMPSASNQECGPQHDTNAWLQHSPMMQRVLEGELMGIWSEPDAEIDTSSTTTAPMDIDDFTTMVGDFFVVYLDVSEHVGEPLHALSWDPDDCLDNYLDSLEYFLHLLDDCGGDYFFAYLDVEFFYFDFVQYHDYDALDEFLANHSGQFQIPTA
ncbi:unnamed protein product [Symbiodinium microadriaticum]|nr:unnamed protein product [Symbiodinium microadriaticum]